MAYRVLSRFVALILLSAAGLKLLGLSTSPVAQVGLLHHPVVTVAVIEWEVLLATLLFLGSRPALARYLALATFLAFAGASGYASLVGSANCGCFGTVQVNPLYVFVFDIAVVAAFAICRPDRTGEPERPRWSFVRPVVAGLALTILVLGGMSLVYGDPAVALAKLRGDGVTATPTVLDFGAGAPGERLTATVVIRNWTGHPVMIVGGTADCSCVAITDLPVRIEPGGRAEIDVTWQLPMSNAGELMRRVELLTDRPEHRMIRLSSRCRVLETGPGRSGPG